ncbi:hypothetical protein B0H34DRAFT_679959 [Crassisporium funariophilum]|nr:hypothetical protein B0H34DRAFT_679959 [Crassisporium funariophilum]
MSVTVLSRITINRFTVIPAYVWGTRAAMTKELITKAFEHTGLYPVRCTVFSKEDFAPSKVSSSIAHVPDDFPLDFPSSDPIDIDPDYEQPLDNSDSDSDLDFDPEETPSAPNNIIDIGLDSDLEEELDALNAETAETKTEEIFEIPDSDDNSQNSGSSLDSTTTSPQLYGLMLYLANMETSVIHMTRSATAKLDLFTVAPPKCVSEHEEHRRNASEMFHGVWALRSS